MEVRVTKRDRGIDGSWQIECADVTCWFTPGERDVTVRIGGFEAPPPPEGYARVLESLSITHQGELGKIRRGLRKHAVPLVERLATPGPERGAAFERACALLVERAERKRAQCAREVQWIEADVAKLRTLIASGG